MSGIKETSTSIAVWAENTFGPATALSTAIRAQKEMTELIEKLALHTAGQAELNPLDIMLEVADIQIVLARIQRFFDCAEAPTVEDAVDLKMAINRKRKWKLDGHGHGQHIKEED